MDDGYDFVVIDTSPTRSLININVLNYASEIWCPVDPGVFSLAGLVQLRARRPRSYGILRTRT